MHASHWQLLRPQSESCASDRGVEAQRNHVHSVHSASPCDVPVIGGPEAQRNHVHSVHSASPCDVPVIAQRNHVHSVIPQEVHVMCQDGSDRGVEAQRNHVHSVPCDVPVIGG